MCSTAEIIRNIFTHIAVYQTTSYQLNVIQTSSSSNSYVIVIYESYMSGAVSAGGRVTRKKGKEKRKEDIC